MQNNLIIGDEWRKNVVKTAFEFANMLWTPTEKNLYHGYDEDGVLVNTPDISYAGVKYDKCGWWRVGEPNQGMAYNWGGICTVEEFQIAISEGKYAGNVPDSREHKRSQQCVGVDCSGLVTMCWRLTKKYSTGNLPSVSSKLDTTDSLLSGDILLLPGSHAMIFIEFTDDTKLFAQIIDATRSTGKVSLRIVEIAELVKEGYSGYYYDFSK